MSTIRFAPMELRIVTMPAASCSCTWPIIAAPLPASCGAPTIAVRIPAHAQLRSLLEETGPMTATSLNRSGQEPCVDPDDAERLFGDELDVLVDGGITAGGPPSTLLDATVDPPRVLRAGAFPWPPASR